MVVTGSSETEKPHPEYDRLSELKAFDESKLGVKGISDTKSDKIPRIFVHENLNHDRTYGKYASEDNNKSIPIISMKGIDQNQTLRKEVVREIKIASEKWGFFQITDHGISNATLTELIEGIRRFHEQDNDSKKKFYSRDYKTKKVLYNSNVDLFTSPAALWRDTLSCAISPGPIDPKELPEVCRDIVLDYSKMVQDVANLLLELLSEALDINPEYLRNTGCTEVVKFTGHYIPPCPEPELTMGDIEHSDSSFITILLQDLIAGLQVQLGTEWFDVDPIPGTLVVNLGDLMQLMSNGKFKSSRHRVLTKSIGPRISCASFFRPSYQQNYLYGPLEELISEHNPPIYRESTFKEFLDTYFELLAKGIPVLEHFKL